MKLSDIDDMTKVAAEYKVAKSIVDFMANNRVYSIAIDMCNARDVHSTIKLSERNNEYELFIINFRGLLEKRLELLQAKLALYGVDKFE